MQPEMEPYRRHVFVCTGGFCSPNRGGRELYALLPELLERDDLLFGPNRVKRGEKLRFQRHVDEIADDGIRL